MYTGPLLTPPSLYSLSFFVFLCRQNKNTDYFSQLGECRTKAHSCCINQSPVWISLKTAGLHICRVLLRRRAYCEHRSFCVVSVDALLWYQIVLWVTHIHSHSYCVLFSSNTCKCFISTIFQRKIIYSCLTNVFSFACTYFSFACTIDHFHFFSNMFSWFIFL